jgi:tRNA A37 methylthiotransferase MiaB
MPGQLTPEVKHRRAARLDQIGRRLRQEYCEQLVGRELQVMAESRVRDRSGRLAGTSDRYVPVEFAGSDGELDRLVPVVIEAAHEGRLSGKPAAPA